MRVTVALLGLVCLAACSDSPTARVPTTQAGVWADSEERDGDHGLSAPPPRLAGVIAEPTMREPPHPADAVRLAR